MLNIAVVVDFGTNRKGVYDFLLVVNGNFTYLAPFLRYGDLLAEKCKFFKSFVRDGPFRISE